MEQIIKKEISIKEKIINSLEGKFEVISVEREKWSDGVGISCKFINNGKTGKFSYILEGRESGIDEITDYEEGNEEDIYGLIHDWVRENISWDIWIKWNSKEVKLKW